MNHFGVIKNKTLLEIKTIGVHQLNILGFSVDMAWDPRFCLKVGDNEGKQSMNTKQYSGITFLYGYGIILKKM